MASKYGPIQGLHVKSGFHKSVLKGEDAWLQKPGVSPSSSVSDTVTANLFGIFDGHGGKQAAVFSSKHLLSHLDNAIAKHVQASEDKTQIPQGLKACDVLPPSTWDLWREQDRLIACLPEAFVSAFKTLQDAIFEQMKTSGTTGTVVTLVGWELIVGNVGDSCAFLDTGTEVLQVSGNHRLDDNKKEKERITSQGFEVSSSKIEGRPTGPLRVWPGGLAMGRSLGDFEAGDIVLSEPEVRQVTLPEQGGRIVVASDGLWDAVNPKTVLHHIRGTPASKAARDLVQLALKGRDLKDDITVLVIDAIPSEDLKMPPILSKDGAGRVQAEYRDVGVLNIYRPLEDGAVGKEAWQRMLWERRLAAAKLAFPEAFKPAYSAEDLLSGSFSETHLDSGDEVHAAFPGREAEVCMSDASDDAEFDHEHYVEKTEESDVAGGEWVTVPEKSKAVPVQSRKHPLQRNDGSPSHLTPSPKAMKETILSPPPGSMQASDVGSAQGSFHGRSRGRGHGRSQGRGRGRRARVQAARQHIDGFELSASSDQKGTERFPHPHHQVAVKASAPDGFSFLAGGGFELQPQSVGVGGPVDGSASTASRGPIDEKEKRPRQRNWRGRRSLRSGRGRNSDPQGSSSRPDGDRSEMN